MIVADKIRLNVSWEKFKISFQLAILQGIMERELKYAKYYKNSSENVLLVDSLIIEVCEMMDI